MIHSLQSLLSTLVSGLLAHLEQWDGWAVVIAAVLLGYRGGERLWAPVLVGLIINPEPYGLVAAVVHGRTVNLNAAALFTLIQLLLGFAGFAIGRLLQRFR